jgi:hypothetical protein
MAPGLCYWHDTRLAAELSAWPELWAALHTRLIPAQRDGDGRGGGEPAPGVNMAVLSFLGPSGAPSLLAAGYTGAAYEAMADQDGHTPFIATVRSWTRLVEEERGPSPRNWTFAGCREHLVRWHEWIIRQPWSDEYAGEMHDGYRTARRLSGRTDPPDRLPVPCPHCEDEADEALLLGRIDAEERNRLVAAAALVRPNGGAHVQCERCGRQWREEEYRRLVLWLVTNLKRGA